jgi:hypothetical protein
MASVIVLTNVDENGYSLGSVEVDLLDENGNRNPLLDSPFLVPPNSQGFYRPKWDFEKLEWTEGNVELALEMTKINLKQQFKLDCNRLIETGFEYDGDRFYFDKDAQLDFTMQLTYINAGIAEGENYTWKTLDNDVKIYTKEQFFEVCRAANNHYRENKGALWRLEVYIDGLTSLDELNSLTDFETAKQLINEQNNGGEVI